MLNKVKGNMFNFVTHTWNPIKGKCLHECSYCYMNKMYKRYKWDKTLRLDEKCLKDNLGKGNFIFIGSSTDMFANDIEYEWIKKVLKYCWNFDNSYLFQSKNPMKFKEYFNLFPARAIFATTIETNRSLVFSKYSKLDNLADRILFSHGLPMKTMLTVEPIMDFDDYSFIRLIKELNPMQVNIGADSGHNNLPEPPKEKIEELITELKKFTTVHLKDNLKRLLK